MAAVEPVGGPGAAGSVGSAVSRVQLEAQYQVQVAKKQQEVVKDLGSAALQLIRTALNSATNVGQDLNIRG